MSEMCCPRLAETQDAKKLPSHTIAQLLSRHIFATKASIECWKKMLNTNTSSTCPDNMVNFGPITAENCWRVWGTPANFNDFRVFAPLLHGTSAVGVSQSAALNRGRHLYSAGRSSRWALAHISIC